VLRGFDGDRVLVLEDGNRIGSLGFQSGDHAEPIDILTLDRVEVVKGPATLLYGSNAIGGVVNAITGHDSAHPGVRSYLTGIAGSNNYNAGGAGGIDYGTGDWLVWGHGGGQRTGDYDTPAGRIANSYTQAGNGTGGFGYYRQRASASLEYTFDKREYGIPLDREAEDAEVVFLNPRRHGIRFSGGLHELESFVDGAHFSLQYDDYRHQEIDSATSQANSTFKNRTLNYRGVFENRKKEHRSGSYGLWGLHRNYRPSGEEALAPPTRQNAFALFALEKLDFARVTLQFGARYEHNSYEPSPQLDRVEPERSFNAFSASAGFRVRLWPNGAFAANYSHSDRAPSLEELYNNGPHRGNATFEFGNSGLRREMGDGIDLALRHASDRLRTELNYFRYRIRNFIFLAPRSERRDGLVVADYAQALSRYTGAEARVELRLHRNWWLLSGADYVTAELSEMDTPLPRIPPLRANLGMEASYGSLRIYPEAILTDRQSRVFPNETPTAGYAIFNLTASYSIARQHVVHVLSLNGYNLGNRLYRNHLSFIKEFAPEIGRGFRLTYTLRFF
jgi:iron complex outermembrane receptor protein